MTNRYHGLTLIELMVTIAVIAVIVAIGVPSLTKYAETNRSASQINLVSGTLNLARSEAIKRGVPVTMCLSGNATTASPPACDGGSATQWEKGWFVYADVNSNGVFDNATDIILAASGGLNGGLSMRDYSVNAGVTTDHNSLTFRPNGSVAGGQNTFKICTKSDSTNNVATHARAINVGNVGMISLAKDSDSDNIVNDVSGADVSCP